jgi:hypothetical protein
MHGEGDSGKGGLSLALSPFSCIAAKAIRQSAKAVLCNKAKAILCNKTALIMTNDLMKCKRGDYRVMP